jgi:hypothetical protein
MLTAILKLAIKIRRKQTVNSSRSSNKRRIKRKLVGKELVHKLMEHLTRNNNLFPKLIKKAVRLRHLFSIS